MDESLEENIDFSEWESLNISFNTTSVIYKQNKYLLAEEMVSLICPPTLIVVTLAGNVIAMKVFFKHFTLFPSLAYLMLLFFMDIYFIAVECINQWYGTLYG